MILDYSSHNLTDIVFVFVISYWVCEHLKNSYLQNDDFQTYLKSNRNYLLLITTLIFIYTIASPQKRFDISVGIYYGASCNLILEVFKTRKLHSSVLIAAILFGGGQVFFSPDLFWQVIGLIACFIGFFGCIFNSKITQSILKYLLTFALSLLDINYERKKVIEKKVKKVPDVIISLPFQLLSQQKNLN